MKIPSLHRLPAPIALGAPAFLLAASLASAMVNPNFTPLHLEKQSRLICAARIVNLATNGALAEMEVIETIKGTTALKKYRLDFGVALTNLELRDAATDAIAAVRKAGAKPVFLALGGVADAPEGALINLESTWLRLSSAKDTGLLTFQSVDAAMNGTFNGGTDMLLHTMRFIRDSPEVPIMPVGPGISWTGHNKIAKASGKAAALLVVDANDDGRPDLFAASPQGDKLLLNTAPDTWTECTGLQAASDAAAWADFDSDGRVDLASLAAAGLRLHLQTAPGKFVTLDVKLPGMFAGPSPKNAAREDARPPVGNAPPAAGMEGERPREPLAACLSLQVIDLGDGRPSLVAGIGHPVLLRNTDGKGALVVVPLPVPEAGSVAGLGPAGPCVAGDLDGDGLADLLQIHEQNGVFWRGRPGGAFEVLPNCGALMGKVRQRRAYAADLDGDGLTDVLLIGGGATPLLLQNRGQGRFEELMRQTGEPGYIIQGGAHCAAIGDFNNDLFPDLFAGYEEEDGQFFFNRGFRSFAIAESLKLREDDVEGCSQGQAAACWLDADRDGALELATVLASGDVYLSRTSLGAMEEPRRIVVQPPRTGGFAGPVVVTLRLDQNRCLASRLADRWSGPAVLAVPSAGRYIISYHTPDGRLHTRTVDADKPVVNVVME
jgi:hypothetical protein